MQSISTSSGLLLLEKLFANNTNDPIDITVQTSAEANKVRATFRVNLIVSPFTPIFAEFGDDDVTAFGTSGNGIRHSAFIDDDAFGAVENPDLLSRFDSLAVISHELYMFTTESIPGLSSTITLCDCNFLKWGFWGGELKPDGGATFERIHGATWVAGRGAFPTSPTFHRPGRLLILAISRPASSTAATPILLPATWPSSPTSARNEHLREEGTGADRTKQWREHRPNHHSRAERGRWRNVLCSGKECERLGRRRNRRT